MVTSEHDVLLSLPMSFGDNDRWFVGYLLLPFSLLPTLVYPFRVESADPLSNSVVECIGCLTDNCSGPNFNSTDDATDKRPSALAAREFITSALRSSSPPF